MTQSSLNSLKLCMFINLNVAIMRIFWLKGSVLLGHLILSSNTTIEIVYTKEQHMYYPGYRLK
jgi:hypothetical protein